MRLNYNFKDRFLGISRHPFVKNVLTLQSGSLAGNIFLALVNVFIARLLQPELFGIYTLAFGLAGIGTILLGSGLQDATSSLLSHAYSNRDKDKISQVIGFFIKLTFCLAIATLVLALLLPVISEKFYDEPMIGKYASIIVLAVIFSSFFLSISSLGLQVTGNIRALTFLMFADPFLRFGISLVFVFLGFGVFGAVSGHLVGAVIIFLVSVLIWRRLRHGHPLLPSLRRIAAHIGSIKLKDNLRFSFWVALDRNIANLYSILPVLMTGIYLAASEVTFFKLAFGYVNLALSLLGPVSTLLNMEFPKMRAQDFGQMGRNFLKVSLFSVALSLLLTICALIVSPFAFKILYGQSYMPSVTYVFGLFVYGALFGIGVGLGPMWRAVDKVRVSILINLATLGAGIPLGLFLIKNFGLWGAVITVTLWYTVSHFISFIYIIRKIFQLKRI